MKSFHTPFHGQSKPFEAPPKAVETSVQIDEFRDRVRQQLQEEAQLRREVMALFARTDLDGDEVLERWYREDEERARSLRDRMVALLRQSQSNARMAQAALEMAERHRPIDPLERF